MAEHPRYTTTGLLTLSIWGSPHWALSMHLFTKTDTFTVMSSMLLGLKIGCDYFNLHAHVSETVISSGIHAGAVCHESIQ